MAKHSVWRRRRSNCRLAKDADLGQVLSEGRVPEWSPRTSKVAVVCALGDWMRRFRLSTERRLFSATVPLVGC